MPTVRNQVMTAFCDAVGGTRGLPFAARGKITGKRSVFDTSESAEKTPYGKILATASVTVEALIEAAGQNEGDLMDAELGGILSDALADTTLGGLAESVTYSESTYNYSEQGGTVVGVGVTFEVAYMFSRSDPSQP